MSNQNQQITGHRQLSQAEIDDINKSKTLANQVGEFIATLEKSDDVDKRWLAIAKTDLQKGFMSLVRSIAKSSSF
ncbi:Acb2/Tad1 domain-containing protein [Moraxella nonliquefaciens]|jgi:hypothetical protein|uniref:Acb2/Tad1 domain-containing protein n=1 Tax=Moraxella nonliquefaciens TaxID=478 RepID=UPI001EF690F8|nr:hypothetical protein [Moraxella nonliquefaciens]MCG7412277.1 hypothetical protein [Moraxella nonliquefaciens]MDI4498769.1 hypothetical protein [Moraxella nonliquefaciens]MDI4500540.1 hypothetical protein [Moraxella nonliquefaciens]